MSHRAKLYALLLPLFLALAILLDTRFHRLGKSVLTGLVPPVERPSLTLRSLWEGTFQSAFEAWFEQELGLRAELVRTENTLNLTVFHDISAQVGIPIVLGKKHTLFEQNYINNLNNVSVEKNDPPPRSPEPPEVSAARIGRAARAFSALRIGFVMVLYPTKAWLERDRIPDRYVIPGGSARAEVGYRRFVDALKANRVPVIDGVELAQAFAREHPDVVLWNRGGTHWTDALACAFTQKIVEIASTQAPRRAHHGPPAELRCTLQPPVLAGDSDTDIARLINVWDISVFRDRVHPVVPELVTPLAGGPRDVLIIGTSYSTALEALLRTSGVAKRVKRAAYYRYFNQGGVALEKDLRKTRLVIFEQWQWSYLTINIKEFLDEAERRVPAFTSELHRQVDVP